VDWMSGSSNRVPALQAQSLQFKLQSHWKKKKRKKKEEKVDIICKFCLRTYEACIFITIYFKWLKQNKKYIQVISSNP
jgi:hypothetical protein